MVRARQNGREISHFRRTETMSKIRCAPEKPGNHFTIKLFVKVQKYVKNCTQQLYNTDVDLSIWPLTGAEESIRVEVVTADSQYLHTNKMNIPLEKPLQSPVPIGCPSVSLSISLVATSRLVTKSA